MRSITPHNHSIHIISAYAHQPQLFHQYYEIYKRKSNSFNVFLIRLKLSHVWRFIRYDGWLRNVFFWRFEKTVRPPAQFLCPVHPTRTQWIKSVAFCFSLLYFSFYSWLSLLTRHNWNFYISFHVLTFFRVGRRSLFILSCYVAFCSLCLYSLVIVIRHYRMSKSNQRIW